MVEMKKVESSNIDQVGYDAEKKELHVIFKKYGSAVTMIYKPEIYVYQDVPEEEFKKLIEAPSIGRYLNKEIKNVFLFDKREPEIPCDDCDHFPNTKNIGDDNERTDCFKGSNHTGRIPGTEAAR